MQHAGSFVMKILFPGVNAMLWCVYPVINQALLPNGILPEHCAFMKNCAGRICGLCSQFSLLSPCQVTMYLLGKIYYFPQHIHQVEGNNG